ncbi:MULTISPECIES: tetratricopeptide repeat protein [Methylotenera]|uniref:tetratricopeptide repeat protein n=1 Tax=Methylotenera TaxID=359407 RepID=UPI000361D8F3|nr:MULTISPECIES: tetratricopeptide repeat protein [Methylotenera]
MNIRSRSLYKLVVQFLFAFSFAASYAFADELKDISQLSDQGQQAAALERVNAYLVANPKDPQALFMKGIILVESGKRDDAIKAFTDLTEKYPNLPEPYNNLAVLYADAGQYDKAKKALETAIKTHPSYATAHENLGDIYARMASEAYDKALQLDNGNTRAQSKLSLIKDLFGTGNKVAMKPTETAKPTKSGTMPIRPADKKVESVKPAEIDKSVEVATSDDEKNVSDAVNSWAKAWSSQDVDKYLASYATSFKPPKGENRKAWEQSRRERISKPSSINVELENEKVTIIDSNNAKATFKQTYKANGKPIRTDKTLLLKKANGIWLIDQEIASN